MAAAALVVSLFSGSALATPSRCLPPAAGAVVSAAIARGIDSGELTLVNADIERDRLILTLRDDQHQEVSVQLLDPRAYPTKTPQINGQPSSGRFFSFSLPKSSDHPNDEHNDQYHHARLKAARSLDASFIADPFVPCVIHRRESQRETAGAKQTSAHWFAWLPLLFVAAALALGLLPTLFRELAAAASARRYRSALLALIVLLVIASGLRWHALDNGYTSDEVANIFRHDAWSLATQDSGGHPPLYRWMFGLPFSPQRSIAWARRASFGFSLLAIIVSFVAARRLHRSPYAAVLAAAILALHPYAISRATLFRSYALWTLLASWHVLALAALRQKNTTTLSNQAQFAVSALLLAQLHYFSVPMLLAEGLWLALLLPRGRRWSMLLAPAGILFLPLGISMLSQSGRIPTGGAGLLAAVRAGLLHTTDWGNPFGIVLLLCVGFSLARYRHITAAQKQMTAGVAAVVCATLVASSGHFLRPPAVLFMLPFGVQSIAGVLAMQLTPRPPFPPTPLRHTPAVMVPVLLAAWLSLALLDRAQQARVDPRRQETFADDARLQAFAQREQRRLANRQTSVKIAPASRRWVLYPSYHRFTLAIYLLDEAWPRSPTSNRPCVTLQSCFEYRGQWYDSADDVSPAALGPAQVLVLGKPPRDQLADCIERDEQQYDCSQRTPLNVQP